jgi:hypothetical protein
MTDIDRYCIDCGKYEDCWRGDNRDFDCPYFYPEGTIRIGEENEKM